MREYSYLHDETTTFNTDFPHRQAEKSPFQQHAVSYTPESDLLDWGVPHGAGFIPAHAVNTHNAARVARLPGDHSPVSWLPPSCAPHHYSEKDSSLLTRGIRDPMPVGHGDRRIIPTHVGNTSPGLRKHHASQADYGSMVERLSLNYSSHRTPTTKEARLESLVRHRCERLQARQTSNH